MGKYQINYRMEFKSRPTKTDVENKLFDLLRDGFTLKTVAELDYDKEVLKKKGKNEIKYMGQR